MKIRVPFFCVLLMFGLTLAQRINADRVETPAAAAVEFQRTSLTAEGVSEAFVPTPQPESLSQFASDADGTRADAGRTTATLALAGAR